MNNQLNQSQGEPLSQGFLNVKEAVEILHSYINSLDDLQKKNYAKGIREALMTICKNKNANEQVKDLVRAFAALCIAI